MRVVPLLLATGCSFALVRAPKKGPPLSCNHSSVIPAIDALGGAGALAVMGGGVILEHTSDDGKPAHFTTYYAGPLLATAILYFYSASFGTDRVGKCQELEQAAVDNGTAQP